MNAEGSTHGATASVTKTPTQVDSGSGSVGSSTKVVPSSTTVSSAGTR